MSLRLALLDGTARDHALPPGVEHLAAIGTASLLGTAGTPMGVSGQVALAGWAFRSAGFAAYVAPDPGDAERIVVTRGHWALENLWGNYILFWSDGEGRAHILRSPVTGPAIYHCAAGETGSGPAFAFTDLALARVLGFTLDRPDAAAIDAEMRIPLLRGHATGLVGVREILPGEIVGLGCAAALPESWSPWDHMKEAPRRVEPDVLRGKVMSVVSAWSMRFGRIQLELSGGLDSSIVAACLAGRHGDWRAITMATTDPDGDERVYARAAAERAQAPLFELMLSDDLVDPTAPLARPRARPGGFGLLAPIDARLLAAVEEYGAEASFTGAGGDNIFGYLTSAAPIVDALRFGGSRAAWDAAGDLARVMNDNVWKALRLAARKAMVPGRLWPSDNSLLSQRFAGREPEHPWLNGALAAWPGQRTYALKLLPIQPFLDGYDRALARPMIAPLLSQPLVEFGLGVPSWQWGEGGQDRALARRAFRSDLPEAVLARRVKGRIESLFYPSFDRHRARLRSFLLDGWLAGEQLIDCDAVRALIDGKIRADGVAAIRVLHLADMERGVRSLASPRSSAS